MVYKLNEIQSEIRYAKSFAFDPSQSTALSPALNPVATQIGENNVRVSNRLADIGIHRHDGRLYGSPALLHRQRDEAGLNEITLAIGRPPY
ncbi:MAG: hypothetical protein ABJN65_09990 [Parasphingorhabdus sp.]